MQKLKTPLIILIIFIIILLLMGPGAEYFVTCPITPCSSKQKCVPFGPRSGGAYGTCRPKKGSVCWLDSECAYGEACLQAYQEDTYQVPGKCVPIGYAWEPLYDGRGTHHFNENNRINSTGPI